MSAELQAALAAQSLADAVDAFEADAVVRGALGETLATEFIRVKRDEWTACARHVSAWELQRYGAFF